MEGFDISQFIEPFIETAKERLLKLEQGFLKLEKGETDKALIEELLREAHTLKGEARMLEFNEISERAHELEDLLIQIRDKKTEPSLTTEALFEKLEEIKKLVKKIKGEEDQLDTSEMEAAETVRVKGEILDKLANLCLETVLNFKQIERNNLHLRHLSQKGLSLKKQWEGLKEEVKFLGVSSKKYEKLIYFQNLLYDYLAQLHQIWLQYKNVLTTQAPISEELLIQSLSSRMLPLSTIFDLYPGEIRNLAKELGKKVNLKIQGREIEIDKNIIEEINKPLVHLLRNAVDHGIEPPLVRQSKGKSPEGTIWLRAMQQEDKVIIEVEDDGAGLDWEKIKEEALRKGIILEKDIKEIAGEVPSFIMDILTHSGFSTKEEVSEISGRGIGLDAVKKVVENLNGSLRIFSYPGKGTKFVLELPITIAMLPALLVKAEGQIFALPVRWVETILEIEPREIKELKRGKYIEIDQQPVSLFDLNQVLGFSPLENRKDSPKWQVVVIKYQQSYAFVVEELVDQREIIVRPLSKYLHNRFIIGASILEDGSVTFILNTSELAKTTLEYTVSFTQEKQPIKKEKIRVLVVDDALITRTLLKNVLLSAGYQVVTATDGLDALDKLAGNRFDVIVTDVEMPRMDGFQLTKEIKGHPHLKDIPVIIVSSHEKEEEKRQGLEAGADAYLPKSTFTQQVLIDTIERLVG